MIVQDVLSRQSFFICSNKQEERDLLYTQYTTGEALELTSQVKSCVLSSFFIDLYGLKPLVFYRKAQVREVQSFAGYAKSSKIRDALVFSHVRRSVKRNVA